MLADLFKPTTSKQTLLRLAAVGLITLLLVMTYATKQTEQNPRMTPVSSRVGSSVIDEKPIDEVIIQDPEIQTPHLGDTNAISSGKDALVVNEEELSDKKLKDSHVVQLKYLWDKAKKNYTVPDTLQESSVVPNVHYLWCGNKWFEFRDYLSVMSVLRNFVPDKITIHYEIPIGIDKLFYHQWLDYLRHDYPYLVMEEMNREMAVFCTADRPKQLKIIMSLLNQEGGLYISHRTWLLTYPLSNRALDFEFSIDTDSTDGYILMKAGMMASKETTYRELLDNPNLKSRQGMCAQVHHVYQGHNQGCLFVRGEKYDHFFPMDIWESDSPFGKIARKLFYGTEEIRKPKPNYDELVPNIGHMVWIGGGEMDYVFYLSLLSMLYIVKVDVVYIHGDQPPSGPNWASIEATPHIRNRVKLIKKTPPSHIYQGVIEPWYRALMSDLIRVDLMINYGGIYADTDAIWVKGLSDEDRGYDAVASYDWVDWSWPYPDSVNFGLSYGKKNAPFWQLFRDTMRTLHNDVHGFTGVMNPYKVLERYPHLLRIDRHLQVICYEQKCHPIWVNDYHNMSRDHTTDNSLVNWREDVNALHWTFPNPKELANETTLRHSSGLFADVGRHVLEAAGLW